MKKVIKASLLMATLLGVSALVGITSNLKNTKPVFATPSSSDLVSDYDTITLSDFTPYDSYDGSNVDWTSNSNSKYHMSAANTTGSVVVKFKQTIEYTQTGKDFHVILRGTSAWNGIDFYQTDDQYKSVHVRYTDTDKSIYGSQVAAEWGGASKFVSGTTYDIEIGAINYADYETSKKIYCYYKVNGSLYMEGDFVNSSDYSLNNGVASMNVSYGKGGLTNLKLADADVKRYEAIPTTISTPGSDYRFFEFKINAPLYDKTSNWGHFTPVGSSTLTYKKGSDGTTRNLTALAFFNKTTMALNMDYNGITLPFGENDEIYFAGKFTQRESGSDRCTFTVAASTFKFIGSKWYFISDYDEAMTFMNTYLHLDDYPNGEEGWCADSTHHYYSTAEEAWSDLSTNAKTIFVEGADFAAGKARLVAWAAANGQTLDGTTLNYNLVRLNFFGDEENGNSLVMALAIISLFAIGTATFAIVKRRRSSSK